MTMLTRAAVFFVVPSHVLATNSKACKATPEGKNDEQWPWTDKDCNEADTAGQCNEPRGKDKKKVCEWDEAIAKKEAMVNGFFGAAKTFVELNGPHSKKVENLFESISTTLDGPKEGTAFEALEASIGANLGEGEAIEEDLKQLFTPEKGQETLKATVEIIITAFKKTNYCQETKAPLEKSEKDTEKQLADVVWNLGTFSKEQPAAAAEAPAAEARAPGAPDAADPVVKAGAFMQLSLQGWADDVSAQDWIARADQYYAAAAQIAADIIADHAEAQHHHNNNHRGYNNYHRGHNNWQGDWVEHDEGLSGGAIAGIVIASVVGVVGLVVVFYCFCMKN